MNLLKRKYWRTLLLPLNGFIIVDNNNADEDVFAKVFKRIRGIVVNKPTKPQAKQWIANELKKKDRR